MATVVTLVTGSAGCSQQESSKNDPTGELSLTNLSAEAESAFTASLNYDFANPSEALKVAPVGLLIRVTSAHAAPPEDLPPEAGPPHTSRFIRGEVLKTFGPTSLKAGETVEAPNGFWVKDVGYALEGTTWLQPGDQALVLTRPPQDPGPLSPPGSHMMVRVVDGLLQPNEAQEWAAALRGLRADQIERFRR